MSMLVGPSVVLRRAHVIAEQLAVISEPRPPLTTCTLIAVPLDALPSKRLFPRAPPPRALKVRPLYVDPLRVGVADMRIGRMTADMQAPRNPRGQDWRHMELNDILRIAVKGQASDIHLKAGLPPLFRVDGALVPLKDGQRLQPEELHGMLASITTEGQKIHFDEHHEVDLAYSIPGLGRFRVNAFMQRGTIGIVFRVIPFGVKTIDQLELPKVVERIAMEARGLVLVTGTTGSGKSTTLAAMIDHINTNRTCHIITIEDPIEFLIRDKRSMVNQREVGVDTRGFAYALRGALRQDPDVILVGEMRDFETIQTALTAAETGHLVMSTLHTIDTTETITRIVSVFPPHQQQQIRLQLASVVRGIISQRLVPRADGRGRVPAVEVLVSTARVRECIGDVERATEIHDAISKGFTTYGMQTFDQSLMSLIKRGLVTYDDALHHVANPDDFALRFKGISGTSDSSWDDFEKHDEEEKAKPTTDLDDALKIDRF